MYKFCRPIMTSYKLCRPITTRTKTCRPITTLSKTCRPITTCTKTCRPITTGTKTCRPITTCYENLSTDNDMPDLSTCRDVGSCRPLALLTIHREVVNCIIVGARNARGGERLGTGVLSDGSSDLPTLRSPRRSPRSPRSP